MHCVFCKIINKEIPSETIYEDEEIIAILDLSQATKGHTLVLTKKHYTNILDIETSSFLKLMEKVKNLSNIIKEAFNAEGINILNNSGEVAGQTVMHIHFHIIPRYKDDLMHLKLPNNIGVFDLKEIANKIKDRMV